MDRKERMNDAWWKNCVVYQIYPRSFQDSNDDGIGDIRGITRRLDYLQELGIDAIWLSPVCRSPQHDNGYDICDYQDIDPIFGTMEDMDELFAEANKRNIRILIDLVLNHTSNEHRWFIEARKGRDNPFHDYYIWRDGTEDTPPNDMRSCFGGSAWTWVPELEQYYFHQFSPYQPDLNWDNPALRQELYDMIRWWMQKGAGGFRLDVIDQVAKVPDDKITANGPMLHPYLWEMNRNTFGKGYYITVGEAWGATPELAKLYSNPDGSEFSMVFQFEHMSLDMQKGREKWDLSPLDFIGLKRVFNKWQTQLYNNGWNSLFWGNHDLPRAVSHFGNDTAYRTESAKMLATLLFCMQGTPYIYQGEELGMTNADFGLQDYRDIESHNMITVRLRNGFTEKDILASLHSRSRDNARTPMQWSTEPNAGFTNAEPWIRVNPNYTEINAAEQIASSNSVLSYYKELIQLRKDYRVFLHGNFQLLFARHKDIFSYLRIDGNQKLWVLCNFYEKEIHFRTPSSCKGTWKLLLSNYPSILNINTLQPYEARIYFEEGSN